MASSVGLDQVSEALAHHSGGSLQSSREFRLAPVPGSVGDLCQLESVPLPVKLFFFRPKSMSAMASIPILWSIPGVHDAGTQGFAAARMVDDVLHICDLGIAQNWAGPCAGLNRHKNLACGAVRIRSTGHADMTTGQ